MSGKKLKGLREEVQELKKYRAENEAKTRTMQEQLCKLQESNEDKQSRIENLQA